MYDFSKEITEINKICKNSMIGQMGIEIKTFDGETIVGLMPVSNINSQPFGVLHGGASAAFAETLGSLGAYLLVANEGKQAVGLEINANHLKSVKVGETVTGKATLLHRGRTTQVWNVLIYNQQDVLVCAARHTVAIIEPTS